jgi:hypothetical protein
VQNRLAFFRRVVVVLGRLQVNLKPAALAFWRLGFGRLGWHGRIIRDSEPAEQGITDEQSSDSRAWMPGSSVD